MIRSYYVLLKFESFYYKKNTCFIFQFKRILIHLRLEISGSSSVGRASAFQAECRQFEPGLPLKAVYVCINSFFFQYGGLS